MIPLIEDNRAEIEELCRRYGVRRLEVFGSAARGDLPERSDLDFIVEFGPLPPGGRSRAFFGLLLGLQDLFQRRVDLVVLSAVENPYFRQEILESKRVVYADVV